MATSKTEKPANAEAIENQSAPQQIVVQSAPTPTDLLAQLRAELNEVFIDRTELINMMLATYIAGTNAFLGGPPGTGKTALAEEIAIAFGGRKFYYLMSATTVLDELVGEIDLAAFQRGERLKRILDNKLADCDLAILDEGFKANSECLNAILDIILYKRIYNGGAMQSCPLNSLFVLSNELPADDSLQAFWDRLTFRAWVEDIDRDGRQTLMRRRAERNGPKVTVRFTPEQVAALQLEAANLTVSNTIIDAALDVVEKLKPEGIAISTRMSVIIVDVLRAWAIAVGDTAVTEEHLVALKFACWSSPKEIPTIEKVLDQVGGPVKIAVSSILHQAKEMTANLGAYNNDPQAKGAWVSQATLADTQLSQMLTELNNLEAGSPGTNTASIKKAQEAVGAMRRDLLAQISSAFSL